MKNFIIFDLVVANILWIYNTIKLMLAYKKLNKQYDEIWLRYIKHYEELVARRKDNNG